jgi:glutamate decarboxylase
MIAPFLDPDLVWDFRLPRVVSINTSGHKYGLVYPGVGWIVWRDADALPDDLIFWVNYLGDNMPTFALNFSRPGAQVVAQYSDDIENYTVFDVSNALRERGWQVPAYTFPENRTDLAALRVVVRRGFSQDLADMLLADLERQLPRLEQQPAPVHDAASGTAFRH